MSWMGKDTDGLSHYVDFLMACKENSWDSKVKIMCQTTVGGGEETDEKSFIKVELNVEPEKLEAVFDGFVHEGNGRYHHKEYLDYIIENKWGQ